MQPNDFPIVCLPVGLSDEAAATLIDFFYDLAEALERHYCGQLLRHAHLTDQHSSLSDDGPTTHANIDPSDPPF
jgi:hypothetical protein